jgi:hypothetical protein
MRILILSMVLVLSAVFVDSSFAEVDKDAVSFLFVQSAALSIEQHLIA